MMYSEFQTTTHGKWILAGEHAVLRGHPALVFPVPSYTLTLHYQQDQSAISADFSGSCGEDIHLLFWSVLEHGLQLIERTLKDISGRFVIENRIPIGAGMGASAALCAALARWFIAQNWVAASELQTFARQLEHLFHGKSSGVDIAGALAQQGVCFQQGEINPLQLNWSAKWYLSFSDQIGITSHCVKKVNELWQRDPQTAKAIDQQMFHSVLSAMEALQLPEEQGLPLLTQAIQQASHCFQSWGLISNSMSAHIEQLSAAGALAAKPTGSGDGGFVLSLWSQTPPADLAIELIDLSLLD